MRFGEMLEWVIYEINSKLTIALMFAVIALATYVLGFYDSMETTFWGALVK